MQQLFPVKELEDYMWEHLASCLIGINTNQTFHIYKGSGRNGKSVLTSLMGKCLGTYKGTVPITLITAKRNSIGSTSSEVAMLVGVRYAVMQEPSKGDKINEGILKELTGGTDPIQARALFKDTITFIPQFKLVVCANVLPEIKAQDHGTWRRIRVVPFLSLFTENPVEDDPFKPYQFKLDSTINEKFDSWKTVFLALLVERVIQTDGIVVDCETVLKASKEYQQKQDVMSQFVDERIERAPGEWLKQTDVNQTFSTWHLENFGTKGPQPKELHTKLDQMFGAKIHKMGWRDIKLIYDTNVGDSVVDDSDADI
jgi:P4 family phage/plasmid primase-like protien